jgi:hypothetical protein
VCLRDRQNILDRQFLPRPIATIDRQASIMRGRRRLKYPANKPNRCMRHARRHDGI